MTLDTPKSLTRPYLEMLEADAQVVNLHERCAYFFDFAMAYFPLLNVQFPGASTVTGVSYWTTLPFPPHNATTSKWQFIPRRLRSDINWFQIFLKIR